jgi:hypothetical protein
MLADRQQQGSMTSVERENLLGHDVIRHTLVFNEWPARSLTRDIFFR